MTCEEEEQMEKFGIGQPVRRVEDPRLLTGRGRFVDDIDLPRQCHGVVLYSPHAHALIKGIDTCAAGAAPGVLCVLTGADAQREGLGPLPSRLNPHELGLVGVPAAAGRGTGACASCPQRRGPTTVRRWCQASGRAWSTFPVRFWPSKCSRRRYTPVNRA